MSSADGAQSDGRPLWRLRRWLRPVRRLVAWSALVDEERSLRSEADRQAEIRIEQHSVDLEHRFVAIEHRLAQVEHVLAASEERFLAVEDRGIRRLDSVASEVVHRSDVQHARLATELQRVLEQLRDQEHERSAVLRVLAGPKSLDLAGAAWTDRPQVEPGWYAVFEELERGAREEIVEQFHSYLRLFRDLAPVVDLGCGRGEFLELAAWTGLPAYGVDSSVQAADACRQLGLQVEEADLFAHLAALEPESLGGAFCAQVVEHLAPEDLFPLFELLGRALKPGGVVVIETPNPASFAVHVHSFWRDPTHVRPVPPPAVWFAARRVGLVVEDTMFSSPPPDEHRLGSVDLDPESVELRLLAKRFNETIESLNELLFGPQNYAVVARKPHG